MRIERPEIATVRHVAENMRAADLREFLALSFAENRAQLSDLLVEKYAHDSGALVAFTDDGEPVAAGAMVEGRPNVATLLFFATPRFGEIAIGMTRFVKHNLFVRFKALGFHRIECISIEGHDASHRWIRILGLESEAVLPGFGKHGETFRQFAWVADHVARPAG